ncbi:unnamed protein product [Mesocestoides corti]|uniref:Male-enhanced antigen 1 n=1 Tax=Mesocestoides corti TaxID=53468 RepID=A0A0R3U5Z5_MESCO|nr:unnamed protein product [Mesocestoides corti]
MRETAITNGLGSQPSTPTSLEDSSGEGALVPFPEHEGYTLLDNSAVVNGDFSDNESSDSCADPLGDATVDEELRRVLDSDGVALGSFPASEEPELPDESSPALLWNAPRSAEDRRIPLSDEKAAEIKASLSGFELPDSGLPAWAKQIPEEVWKQRLLERISMSPLTK